MEMMQTPVKLLIPFESLVDAIAALNREEKIALRQILDRDLTQTQNELPEPELLKRGCQLPLKPGFPAVPMTIASGCSNIAADHDNIISEAFKAES